MPQKRACSRVISVRYGTGCYRHLRIPSSRTLEGLADAILEAFGPSMAMPMPFSWTTAAGQGRTPTGWTWGDDDWEWEEEEEGRPTSGYTLDVLAPGQPFKFVFNFGENWCFQCKSLREMGDCDDVRLLRTKGGAAQAVRAARGLGRRGRWNLTPV